LAQVFDGAITKTQKLEFAMHVACCQFDIVWEDKTANFAKVKAMVAGAALPEGTLLLLPEMFATGFSMNAAGISERDDGPTARFMAKLATDHGIYVLGGVVISGDDQKPRNEAMLFDPAGRLVSRYAKMHLFTFTGESGQYFPGGERGLFSLPDCRSQVTICYDLRFPELFRSTPVPELLAVIANWPDPRESHWLTLLRARAIENQAYVVAVNRCGVDPRWNYTGRSQIIGPRGEVIADAGGRECVIVAELSLDAMREYRSAFPALADMREDLLHGSLETVTTDEDR
jgi:omega-amidase